MTAPAPPGGLQEAGSPAAGPASPRAVVLSSRASFVAAAAPRLAALLLGAACVAWTATPLGHSGLAGTALTVAVVAVTTGALRLALADLPQLEESQREVFYLPVPIRIWLAFLALLRLLPWEEIAAVALIWLEVLHPARPWHTAALGAALVGYLLTVHIAESGAEPGRLLRRQAKVLIAGACLLALGAGFAALPATAPGAGSALLRVLAAVAVIAAAALALPALPVAARRDGVLESAVPSDPGLRALAVSPHRSERTATTIGTLSRAARARCRAERALSSRQSSFRR